jgi:hypothetical protein
VTDSKVALRAWPNPNKSLSFNSSSRIRPLKDSIQPFCIGFPGAM